ncbi:hypothetical protein SAMN05421881_106317 [Nitrosomonas halophila]|uniref:Uncharacterized protein n=1 Tax=Nitrosomonas halophila TaxID=44576 RepID=A0A1H3MQS7_9PROT|nr:hypothetical protein SAMN05421881_106317 [Nitrosomonas halophila]
MGSLALRPALLLCGNSRPRVAATPFPHATGAYGQLPGRDFNPLDLLLLLRTDATLFISGLMREGRQKPALYSFIPQREASPFITPTPYHGRCQQCNNLLPVYYVRFRFDEYDLVLRY